MKGSCRPTMAPSVTSDRWVTWPSTVIGTPSAPKATGAVLKISVKVSASIGAKPTRISSALVMAIGVPKPGDALEQRAEAEADDDQHDAAVVRQVVDEPVAEGVEAARRDRDVVEQQRVDDDPHDRPEREDHAVAPWRRAPARSAWPDRDGQDEGGDEAGRRRLPGRPAQHAEQHQHDHDRQSGDEKGQRGGCRRPASEAAETSTSPHPFCGSMCRKKAGGAAMRVDTDRRALTQARHMGAIRPGGQPLEAPSCGTSRRGRRSPSRARQARHLARGGVLVNDAFLRGSHHQGLGLLQHGRGNAPRRRPQWLPRPCESGCAARSDACD